MIADRRCRATQIGVGAEEMLVADDRYRPLLGKGCAYSIRADARFCPDRPGPQAKRVEILVVAGCTAPFERNPLPVGQQQATACPANSRKEPVTFLGRFRNQPSRLLAGTPKFLLSQA